MPAATTFSHSLRSKCADLPELLPYSCHSPASIPVNIINFIRIYPRLPVYNQRLLHLQPASSAPVCLKQNHIRLLVHKRIYQLHTFWLQSVPCQGHDDFRQPEGPVHQEKIAARLQQLRSLRGHILKGAFHLMPGNCLWCLRIGRR